MIRVCAAAGLAALIAGSALAGGVDRSGQPIGALFEPGNYVEFSFSSVNATVSGTQLLPAPGVAGSSSGDMVNSAGYAGMALKFAVSDALDVALIYDEPYGASVTYPTGTGYFAGGSVAKLNTTALTGIARYRFGENFSVHAGVRHQTFGATALIPFVAGYSGIASSDDDFGYLVGAAYERPDIALRVALTYNSKIEHNMATTETFGPSPAMLSTTTVETPQSVNLDFQTGIAQDTLLFGGVRWVQWSDFVISPAAYTGLVGAPLVSFADDTITYTVGVGRRLNENWSIAGTVTHEPATGGLKSNLAPTDGRSAVGVGVTYRQDDFRLTAGVQHIWIGDATTAAFGFPAGDFSGNTAVAFGLKAGFNF